MFYRVQQFIKAVTARITDEDIVFVRSYLSEQESQLFFKLRTYEQRHCIDVASKLNVLAKGDNEMIRLGLLHDIGKIQYPLSPVEKSIMVVLDRASHGKIKKYSQFKMVKCYYEHPKLGYDLLKKNGSYEKSFLDIIQSHHQEGMENTKLILLQEADNLS